MKYALLKSSDESLFSNSSFSKLSFHILMYCYRLTMQVSSKGIYVEDLVFTFIEKCSWKDANFINRLIHGWLCRWMSYQKVGPGWRQASLRSAFALPFPSPPALYPLLPSPTCHEVSFHLSCCFPIFTKFCLLQVYKQLIESTMNWNFLNHELK